MHPANVNSPIAIQANHVSGADAISAAAPKQPQPIILPIPPACVSAISLMLSSSCTKAKLILLILFMIYLIYIFFLLALSFSETALFFTQPTGILPAGHAQPIDADDKQKSLFHNVTTVSITA